MRTGLEWNFHPKALEWCELVLDPPGHCSLAGTQQSVTTSAGLIPLEHYPNSGSAFREPSQVLMTPCHLGSRTPTNIPTPSH